MLAFSLRRALAALVCGACCVLALAGCPTVSDCSTDRDCKGNRVCNLGVCEDPIAKKACGAVIAACGCYGLSAGRTVNATGCDSGTATVEACGGSCGASPATQNRCSCGATSVSGSTASGGPSCAVIAGGVQTLGPPSIQCGIPGS